MVFEALSCQVWLLHVSCQFCMIFVLEHNVLLFRALAGGW
jgi:hypothetical protein